MDVRNFVSPGPVASAFLQSRETVRSIMGPFGSGKTNLIIMDALTCATQMPKCADGNRYFRGIILRDNYTNVWKTLIPTWWEWFPKDVGKWSGSDGRQSTHDLIFDMPDGGLLYFDMWFLAIQDSSIENVLRGIEFTWGNINEADLVSPDVLPYMLMRVEQRRYPPQRKFGHNGGPPMEPVNYFVGITMDFNPPDMENWLYELHEEIKPEGHRLFKQPSGRGPKGENRQAIARSVYENMARKNAHKPWLVRRMVDGEWGYSRDGHPVYEDYVDSHHCAEEPLKPIPGVGLRLGFDQGIRGPVMVVSQYTHEGQLRILREYAPGRMGTTVFGTNCKRILATEFRDYGIDAATCDPAGKQGSVQEDDHHSWYETVQQKMGISIGLAESNEIDVRIDGVGQLLRFNVSGGQPALLISPTCKMTRKGFNSHYRYKKRKNGNQTTIDPKPEKNQWADVADAIQYIVQDLMGLEAIISGALTGSSNHDDDDRGMGDNGGPPMEMDTDFDVFA